MMLKCCLLIIYLGLAAHQVDPIEAALRSDMLMSLSIAGDTAGIGTDRYSVRHSIHIGLAAADLKLEPANEEMAKGMCTLCIV